MPYCSQASFVSRRRLDGRFRSTMFVALNIIIIDEGRYRSTSAVD